MYIVNTCLNLQLLETVSSINSKKHFKVEIISMGTIIVSMVISSLRNSKKSQLTKCRNQQVGEDFIMPIILYEGKGEVSKHYVSQSRKAYHTSGFVLLQNREFNFPHSKYCCRQSKTLTQSNQPCQCQPPSHSWKWPRGSLSCLWV